MFIPGMLPIPVLFAERFCDAVLFLPGPAFCLCIPDIFIPGMFIPGILLMSCFLVVCFLRVIFRFGPSTRDEHTCADASQRGWSSCSSRSWHERREGKADVRVSNRRDSNAQSNPSHGQLKDARIASNLNKRSEFADIVA